MVRPPGRAMTRTIHRISESLQGGSATTFPGLDLHRTLSSGSRFRRPIPIVESCKSDASCDRVLRGIVEAPPNHEKKAQRCAHEGIEREGVRFDRNPRPPQRSKN